MHPFPRVIVLFASLVVFGCSDSEPASSSGDPAAAPADVTVAPGDEPGTAMVSFVEPPGSATSYAVLDEDDNVLAEGQSSPITVTGLTPGAAHAFRVVATTESGTATSEPTGLLSFYEVVATFDEPMCDPNDSIFTGTFTFDATAGTVSHLSGSLTQSMTKVGGEYASPMTTVALEHQLASEAVTLGGSEGLLVTTFALDSTDVFSEGGFAPCGTEYYGLEAGLPNAHNAYTTIFVTLSDPTAELADAQLRRLAYADCTEGGMMMSTCMTGTSNLEGGYGCEGTMGGYPLSQVITPR